VCVCVCSVCSGSAVAKVYILLGAHVPQSQGLMPLLRRYSGAIQAVLKLYEGCRTGLLLYFVYTCFSRKASCLRT
jgi:hypothetical protein